MFSADDFITNMIAIGCNVSVRRYCDYAYNNRQYGYLITIDTFSYDSAFYLFANKDGELIKQIMPRY